MKDDHNISKDCRMNRKPALPMTVSCKSNARAPLFSVIRLTLAILAALLGAIPTAAMATLIDPSIAISGSAALSFDSTALTNATQSGTVDSIIGSTDTTSTLSGNTITGTNPLAGTLTSIGDGFGIGFTASGTAANGNTSQIGNLFGDYSFTIANNSATDTFTVNLKLNFSESVDATGVNAFAQSQTRLADATSATEYLFLGLSSDTLNSNTKYTYQNPVNQAIGSGGALNYTGSIILSFILAPGAQVNLGDNSFEVNLLGGAFDAGDSFSAAVSTLYTVDSVVKQQAKNVPEPQTFLLLTVGLILLSLYKRPIQYLSFRSFQSKG